MQINLKLDKYNDLLTNMDDKDLNKFKNTLPKHINISIDSNLSYYDLMDMNLFELFDPAVCSFDELNINVTFPAFGLLIDLSKRVKSVIVREALD